MFAFIFFCKDEWIIIPNDLEAGWFIHGGPSFEGSHIEDEHLEGGWGAQPI